MKKWKKSLLTVIAIIMPIFFTGSIGPVKPAMRIKASNPIFSASFIQAWYAGDWCEDRWLEEVSILKESGVEEIIIQTIADTKSKYAYYPTKMAGYTYGDIDMVKNALCAADKSDIKIRLGLGFSDDWWVKNAMDKAWLEKEAKENKNIFDEIIDKYGSHKSLKGWYIPYEFYQLTAITEYYQANLNYFLKEIASEIKSKSDKDIMISPFYISNFSWIMPLKGWSKMVENAIKDTGIDILALQDGIGVKNTSINELDNLFSHTKHSTDKLGIRLYGNVETFDSTPKGNVPAQKERISNQLIRQKPYVEEFIAFSLNHFQKNEERSRLGSFIKYLEDSLY